MTITDQPCEQIAQRIIDRAAYLASATPDDVLGVTGLDPEALADALAGVEHLALLVARNHYEAMAETGDLDWDDPVVAAHADDHKPLVLSRRAIDSWAGDHLTDEQFTRLARAIPNSSVPDAVEAITSHLT